MPVPRCQHTAVNISTWTCIDCGDPTPDSLKERHQAAVQVDIDRVQAERVERDKVRQARAARVYVEQQARAERERVVEQAREHERLRRLDVYRDAQMWRRPVMHGDVAERELVRILTAIRDQLAPPPATG